MSKNLEAYIQWFLLNHTKGTQDPSVDPHKDRKIQHFSAYCLRRYESVWRMKGLVRMPTLSEINNIKTAPFSSSFFGGDLQNLMEEQRSSHPDLAVPFIFQEICNCIVLNGGIDKEGIFRMASDINQTYDIKVALERGERLPYPIDPHIPSNLAKTWLKELMIPVITPNFYDSILIAGKDVQKLNNAVSMFNDCHRNLLFYLLHFVRFLTKFQVRFFLNFFFIR